MHWCHFYSRFLTHTSASEKRSREFADLRDKFEMLVEWGDECVDKLFWADFKFFFKFGEQQQWTKGKGRHIHEKSIICYICGAGRPIVRENAQETGNGRWLSRKFDLIYLWFFSYILTLFSDLYIRSKLYLSCYQMSPSWTRTSISWNIFKEFSQLQYLWLLNTLEPWIIWKVRSD